MTSESSQPDTPSVFPAQVADRLSARLRDLYGEQANQCLQEIEAVTRKYDRGSADVDGPRWSERDIVLITYGDQVQSPEMTSLQALREFLSSAGLFELINTVHILPFSPYSSDDGFSVIDYRQVDPDLGTWQDVRDLSEQVSLMFDLVLNHCSQHSEWFQGYLRGEVPYDQFFLEVDPATDLSAVTRPRSLPLLTPYETADGTRHVWTTFSDDQVDVNFGEPKVLVEFIDILLSYVSRGARVIRLDAIAYLWKQIGTNCIHLPQTHQVVKILRDVLDAVAPEVLLLTETNVPHSENVSYFGDGDEAHLVYQFSLPPLLLDAFLSHDASALSQWLANLETTPPGTSFFNFTASHDGVGVRPLEGIVSEKRIDRLVEAVKQRGGHVAMKQNPDGSQSPYELNIAYVDALGEPGGMDPQLHARRFLSSQAIMLSLPGIPGIYFHSLLGTTNDHAGVKASGIARRINRRKFQLDEAMELIDDTGSLSTTVFQGYKRLLQARISTPAFHPDGACELIDLGDPALFSIVRTSPDRQQQVQLVVNFSDQRRELSRSKLSLSCTHDLLSEAEVSGDSIVIEPYAALWLTAR
jgi:glycosidase